MMYACIRRVLTSTARRQRLLSPAFSIVAVGAQLWRVQMPRSAWLVLFGYATLGLGAARLAPAGAKP
jgi:hypothetical protein